jgi:hypothetical protein
MACHQCRLWHHLYGSHLCRKLCENFLYGFKAALRAARAADTGRPDRAPAPLPPGRPLTPCRLARKAKAGPRKPGEVTEPRRI